FTQQDDGTVTIARQMVSPMPVTELSGVADVAARIAQRYPTAIVEECRLGPAQYHPRIWRGELAGDVLPETDQWALSGLKSLGILDNRLAQIFNFIEPAPQNENAYGHELRHLLILACTEVESSCR